MSAVFYFGKIPGRGDFVKSANAAAVIQQLDTWITRAMEMMLEDPDWKRRYDDAPPISFLFAGTRSRHVIAGRLVTSHDASSRRFPLLVGTLSTIDDSTLFLTRAPLVLASSWTQFSSYQARAMTAENPASALAEIESADDTPGDPHRATQRLLQFMEQNTLAALEAQFDRSEPKVDLRRSLLALGILLQPMLTQARPEAGRSLSCPLPQDPDVASLMAAFWMDLVVPFLVRSDLELGVLQTVTTRGPVLTICFGGAHPRALETIWRQGEPNDHAIDIRDVDWVEEMLPDAYNLGKLSSYLQHPTLTLSRATRTFRETFLGQ